MSMQIVISYLVRTARAVIKKICKHHGYTNFASHKDKNTTRLRCRKCQTFAVEKRRRKIKDMAVEYAGGKCSICGYNKCRDALEFHHKNPEEKDFGISSSVKIGWDKIKKEVDKCTLLCSNCHRELHYNLRLYSSMGEHSPDKGETLDRNQLELP